MVTFPKNYERRDQIETLRIQARELRDQGSMNEAQRLDERADALEADE